ncbi:MAG: hypothetical protein ACYC67_22440 [Prosthecobacter sp.]
MALVLERLSFGPGCRGRVLDLLARHRRQAGEHITRVNLRINAKVVTGFDYRERHSAALSCSLADKEPVLLAYGCGVDHLHLVVSDLDPARLRDIS